MKRDLVRLDLLSSMRGIPWVPHRQALDHDRVIALRPVGVSLCVGLIVQSSLLEPRPPLYSQEVRVLVGLQ